MPELLDSNTFLELVDETRLSKDISYIDAVLEVCTKRGLDVESVPDLLTPKLKKKIQVEAQELHMVKKRKKKNV